MSAENPIRTDSVYSNLHFTYRAPSGFDLQQGDLLRKSEEIKSVLRDVHPHYLKGDYSHYVVLTQSCDLIQRDSKNCKARYITLAAVRPLRVAVAREIEHYQARFDQIAKVCRKSKQQIISYFLEHLYNNNESAYFYLHEQPEVELPSSCAFLRLSIPIRAGEHYDTCLNSRILSLSEVFQAKLGWLVGNLYSRVGTEDWTPRYLDKLQMAEWIKQVLDEEYRWVDDDQLKAAQKSFDGELESSTRDALRAIIERAKKTPKIEEILDRLCTVLIEQGIVENEHRFKEMRKILKNDPEFSSMIKK